MEETIDGAIIAKVALKYNSVFVVYTDGSVREFECVDQGYDSGYALEESEPSMADRRDLGVITEAELQAYYTAENERLKPIREAEERRKYDHAKGLVEKLKHKYG